MKFVADANVLFALTKPDSSANGIVAAHKLILVAPDFALEELRKYKAEILAKSGEKNFDAVIGSLNKKVAFISIEVYGGRLKSASKKLSDIKDAPYLALAQKFNIPIWSNDPDLKEQKDYGVFTTKELVELLKNRIKP